MLKEWTKSIGINGLI
jgi:hypothetical protein